MMCSKSTDSGDRRILSTIYVLPVLKRFMYDAFERELVDRKFLATLSLDARSQSAKVVSLHLIDPFKKKKRS